MMQLANIANALGAELVGGNQSISGVTIDSRGSCEGKLFVALKGDRFDGHQFIKQARAAGAAALLVEELVDTDMPTIRVADSHAALKQMAKWWRSQFSIPVVGVTGSVGKTSVKEMLASIFALKGKGLVTQGNLNNEIGLPLTLLRLDHDDQFAIVEMGMNHAGEISRLTDIAKPDVAMINNAAAAHLEGLGSVEGVAKAKGEIFEGLQDDGVGIINADDDFVGLWRDLLEQHTICTFGLNEKADVSCDYQLSIQGLTMKVVVEGPQFTSVKPFSVSLNTLGKHNVYNALAAISVALTLQVPVAQIQTGLANYRPIKGRLNVYELGSMTLIDDSYNANPASMSAAIDVLSQFDNTALIVGDMAEIGDAAEREHLRIGSLAKDSGIDCLIACGEYAELVIKKFNGQAHAFENQATLLEWLKDKPLDQRAVLVKGSRSAQMENVAQSIKDSAANSPSIDARSSSSSQSQQQRSV